MSRKQTWSALCGSLAFPVGCRRGGDSSMGSSLPIFLSNSLFKAVFKALLSEIRKVSKGLMGAPYSKYIISPITFPLPFPLNK
jgi:hypothetical protein